MKVNIPHVKFNAELSIDTANNGEYKKFRFRKPSRRTLLKISLLPYALTLLMMLYGAIFGLGFMNGINTGTDGALLGLLYAGAAFLLTPVLPAALAYQLSTLAAFVTKKCGGTEKLQKILSISAAVLVIGTWLAFIIPILPELF